MGTDKGFASGNRYRITLVSKGGEALSPNSWNPQDGLVIHTYREPTISNMSVSRTTFSPQDNPTTTFTVNGSRWSSYENNFTTTLRFGSKTAWNSSNNNPTQNNNNGVGTTNTITQTISATNINNSFSAAERSVNSISTKFYVIRTSPTTGATASANKDIKIQFQPTQSPNNVSMLDNNNKDVKGKTVVIQDSTSVKVSLTYPTTSGGTGVVNGYYVTVYKDSNYSQVAIAEKTIVASGTNASASVTFNTADLARGIMNYIKITPYYTKPNGTGTIRGTTDYKNALVKPISRLGTPVIDYPKNNKTWLNNKFRILFKLPEDPDFSKLGVIEENYIYKDIQVKVTPAGKSALTFAYTNTTYNAYYSCANLKQYKKAVAFNPSLYSSLADVSSYKLQIRVRKNYNIDGASEEDTWSAWSSEVTINVGKISEFNLNRGDIIKLTHYKTPRDKSVQMREAYPFSSLPSNNVAKVAGDIVEYKNYKAIYDTVKAIQTGVNNYCTYDRADVKYNTIVNAFDSPNQPKQEIIAAQKEPEDIDGRNYMNIVIQEMNKLV